MWRRTPAAGARRSTGARRGTAATPSASASVNASRRRSAGSRQSPDSDKTRFRGRDRVGWAFAFAAAAYNLVAAAEAHGAGRLMAKAPAFAKAFTGRWRIVEMDVWENDFLDLVEEAHLTFRGNVRWRNCLRRSQGLPGRTLRHPRRFSLRGVLMGRARREYPACGRGWVMIGTAGCLVGHFYIRNGHDSGFVRERA